MFGFVVDQLIKINRKKVIFNIPIYMYIPTVVKYKHVSLTSYFFLNNILYKLQITSEDIRT